MRFPDPFRGVNLSTRFGAMLTAILMLAAAAQTVLYFRTRSDTLAEADATYQSLAVAIQVAATQIGPEGWKDDRVLADYTDKLKHQGLREIRVTEGGRPFPDPMPSPAPVGKKKGSKGQVPTGPRDILISGVVGEGVPNRTLRLPLVAEGRLLGDIEIKYTLENITEQLADNFRRRLYALLGVFALGLVFLLLLTRSLTHPLDQLSRAAALVADGRLDVKIEADRDDEVGVLVASFNRMTEKLRERQNLEVRLAAAEKRAEIGHLASGLAHEIKNPLNALSLGLDVLRRRHRPAEDGAAAEYAARIETLREEINRLTTLINNFLSYGRPLTLTPAPTDLAALVEGTLDDLSELAARAHVTIEREIPAGLPRVLVDGSLTKSAVWNLVQNAVQSMERTGGAMRVALRLDGDETGRRLVLTVEDTGAGIPESDMPRLFEPYFSKKEGGVGLGLAMVKRIVEDHGGRVAVENRGGGVTGARFRMTLPVPA